MTILEWIGSMTVAAITVGAGMLTGSVIRETVRAFRQTRRVARYVYGKRWSRRLRERRIARQFLREWRRHFFTGEFSIGVIVFPADPTKPFRRTWGA